MKFIAIFNWSLIGLYTLLILYSALTLKQTTDAAGRALGTVYLISGAVLLVIIVGVNLLPFRYVKLVVFILLATPSLYGAKHTIKEFYVTLTNKATENQQVDGRYYFSDSARQQLANAIANQEINRLKTIVSQPIPGLNDPGKDNTTLLDFAAMRTIHSSNSQAAIRCVSVILQKGATVQSDTHHPTPTHALVGREGSAELLSLFLEHGANPNALSTSGLPLLLSMLDYPVERAEKVNLLLTYGANPNSAFPTTDTGWLAGHSALLAAARMELWAICQLLVKKGADLSFEGPQHIRFPELIQQYTKTYEQSGSTPPEFTQLKKVINAR